MDTENESEKQQQSAIIDLVAVTHATVVLTPQIPLLFSRSLRDDM